MNKDTINIKQVILLSLLISSLLFVTGLVSIPTVQTLTPIGQNFFYFLGRLPIIFISIIVFFNIGKCNVTSNRQ